MIPSIGRTVHYVLPASLRNTGHHRAAIVTNCAPDPSEEKSKVSLTVFLDGADERAGSPPMPFLCLRDVPQDPSGKPGTWHEPERK